MFADMQSVLSTLLFLAGSTAGYLTPSPVGKYNVTLTTGELVDHSRNDIYAPTPTPRALMLSIFQPADCKKTGPVPYMPKKTAKYQGPFIKQTFNITQNFAPLFLGAELPVCPSKPDGCAPLPDSPVLLFSPGYSFPRLIYSVLASSIASQGFTVITIDHPHDADIIVYPDGRAVYNNNTIVDNPTWDYYPRAGDASFIIDQLSNATAMASLGAKPFKTDQIAMFGHSCGGAASIVAAKEDKRIRAAINWDGTIFGSPDLSGLSQPIMFLTHDKTIPPDWKAAWPELEGPKMIARINGTTHESFSDMPTLVESAGEDVATYADLLGSIAPAEMVEILTAYTSTWMKKTFEGKVGGALLEGKSKFPEVSVLKKDNY